MLGRVPKNFNSVVGGVNYWAKIYLLEKFKLNFTDIKLTYLN